MGAGHIHVLGASSSPGGKCKYIVRQTQPESLALGGHLKSAQSQEGARLPIGAVTKFPARGADGAELHHPEVGHALVPLSSRLGNPSGTMSRCLITWRMFMT